MRDVKRNVAILLAGLLALSLAGCGQGTDREQTAETGAAAESREELPALIPQAGENASSLETSAEGTSTEGSSQLESSAGAAAGGESAGPENSGSAASAENGVVFQEVQETVYATERVNLRREPSLEAEVLTVLSRNQPLERTGVQEEWSRVSWNGEQGYAASRYLTTEEPHVTEPQAGTGIYHQGGSLLVVIDPGHQSHQMTDTEPNGPGSSELKAKVSSGTEGVSTGNEEYRINLEVALLLRDELLSRGYSVLMSRETNDVELSNVERAQLANNAGADAMVRIHCNSSDSSSVRGALGICQTQDNPYCGNIYEECLRLTEAVLEGHCESTGVRNTGVWETDTMTGTNWCQVPNTIIEMGYMSNPEEDDLLGTSGFWQAAAEGIADGLDAYFGR